MPRSETVLLQTHETKCSSPQSVNMMDNEIRIRYSGTITSRIFVFCGRYAGVEQGPSWWYRVY